MALPVEILAEAELEVAEAIRWYSERSTEAPAGFMSELDRGINQIVQAPERWPRYIGGTQRYRLRRFPFYLVYYVRPESIRIIAVAHVSREPGYWSRRS